MRAALYCRVSTDEQARHGISIDAQLAALRVWAEREGHTVAGEYIDAGISGKKPPSKRPELSRLFRELESGLQIDILAFCKLDRFFRSVKLYYQAMDTLDRYHIAWQAIHEDYETLTASGRMKVNIMLSVAENEADRTSERIRAVFDHKIAKGEPVTRSQPFGFEISGKKLIHSADAPAAREAFEMFARTGNTYAVRDMIQTKYGRRLPYEAVYRFLQNPLYTGRYRDNPAYCEPIVSKELFDSIQRDFAERRKTKKTPSGRVYLFSGLIVCATCGRRFTVSPGCKAHLHPERYRCPGHLMGKTCTNRRTIQEFTLEQHLLQHVTAQLNGTSPDYATAQPKPRPAVSREEINRKLERLKDLYIDGDITREEYTARREKLSAPLETPPPPQPIDLRAILGASFADDYPNFSREEKRSLWRTIIDHITVDEDLHIQVYYCLY